MSDSNTTQEPKTKQRFSRQQKLILLVLIGVNLCVFGAMWLMTQGSGTVSRPPTLVVGEKLELQEAYEQALALAMGWQADVQVVGATTSWQLAAGDAFTLHRPAWSFSFYSPTARRVQIVTVDHGGAQAGPQQPLVAAPQVVAADWSMGSDDLVLTFLSYGGSAFVGAHPSANIHLQLKADAEGRSIWYITAVDPKARQSLLVSVDARSREVIVSDNVEGGA